MHEMSTTVSGFTACSRLAPLLVRLAPRYAATDLAGILICNQGVGSSSLSGGTLIFNGKTDFRASRARLLAPFRGTSIQSCASVPQITATQHHHTAPDPSAGLALFKFGNGREIAACQIM